MSTPFELKLENELDVEWQRFANKWLFPWHQMNIEGRSFTVEDFRGGHISYGGIKFGDQQQNIFWAAIERYLKGKVHEAFRQWDAEAKEYPAQICADSLEGTVRLVRKFVGTIMRQSVDTDQRLRGAGYPPKDTPVYASKTHAAAIAEIERLCAAYKALVPAAVVPQRNGLLRRLFGSINIRPGLFGVSVDLKKLLGLEK